MYRMIFVQWLSVGFDLSWPLAPQAALVVAVAIGSVVGSLRVISTLAAGRDHGRANVAWPGVQIENHFLLPIQTIEECRQIDQLVTCIHEIKIRAFLRDNTHDQGNL